MKKLKALLFGQCFELAIALPSLLDRAGFEIDMIFNNPAFKKSKFIKNLDILEGKDIIKNLSHRDLDIYDLIIPCDDATLKLVLDSDLTVAKKLKLLPVASAKGFEHIFSKIGLSKALSAAGVLTPPFLVANGASDAKKAAENLGYPVMIKANSSSGGEGVFECQTAFDIDLIRSDIFNELVLVQKKIVGIELDLSAFYRDEKLIFFSYSKIQKVVANKFGPSVLRLYKQVGALDRELFLEMEKLGIALEANGFSTITCIETADKKRYFVEADMRPNSWAEFPKFLGNDPAIKIANWFLKKEVCPDLASLNNQYAVAKILPYFNRMSAIEILLNRYGVWKYLPYCDSGLLFYLLAVKFKLRPTELEKYRQKIKALHKKTKRLPTNLIRMAVPAKADRIKIRSNIKGAIEKVVNEIRFFKKS